MYDDELRDFCRKFEADVRRSDKRFRRVRRMGPFSYHDLDSKLSEIAFLPYDEEPLVEISLPQDRFRHLIEMERWLSKIEREYQGAKKFIDDEQRAKWIRSKDARVAKAYEKYIILLRMVENDYD